MAARQIIIYSLLLICLCTGCGRKQEDIEQPPEPSVELTLPQIPKLPASYKPTNKEIQIAHFVKHHSIRMKFSNG